MRFKNGFCRNPACPLFFIAALAACSSVPPPSAVAPLPSPVTAAAESPPSADPEPVPAPPEKPAAVEALPAPGLAEIAPIADEPESPFGESDQPAAPPAEPEIVLSDAPLPSAPQLTKAPEPPAPPAPRPSDEPPEVSPPVAVKAPPAVPAAEKPKPAATNKEAPKKAPPVQPITKDSIVKEPTVKPVVAIPDAPAAAIPAVEQPIEYSRKIRLTAGQLLEIPYRGAGWIFLGEQNAKKGLPYDSRRLDKDGQSFMFRAESEGVFALKFYRQDFVNDFIVNDYVQVTVDPAPASTAIGGFATPVDRGRVIAEPRWPPIPDVALAASPPTASTAAAPPLSTTPVAGTAPAKSPAAVAADPGIAREAAVLPVSAPLAAAPASSQVFDPSTIPENAPVEEYLAAARREFDAGRVASALAVLDRSKRFYPAGSDETWWLYGKLLESNGSAKDVKASLAYYRKLVDEYPQSPRYEDARKRIAYLQRYYFEIR